MSLGGGGGGDTTTTQKSDPWAGVAPYLADVYAGARQNYDTQRTRPGFYPGQLTAGFRPEEQIGQQAGINASFRQVPRIADQANRALGMSLSPGMLSPDSNPYLAQAAQHAINPIFDQLTERALPAIRHGSQAAGQDRGSTRSQLGQGLAASRAARDAAGTTAAMYSQGYGQGLDQMRAGMQLAPSMAGLNYMPSQHLQQIGGQRRAMDQAAIDESRARFEHGENAPFESLQRYASLIQPGLGAGGTTSTTGPDQGGGGSAIGSAAGGALMGYALPGAAGGPGGMAIGGGLGLLSGLF